MNNMMQLAEHILAVGQEKNIAVSNLFLQKVLYFTLKAGYRNKVLDKTEVEDIYDEVFLVWKYGPVVESIYDKFAGFGSNSIYGEFMQTDRFEQLNDIIEKLLNMDVFSLVALSHREKFWIENKPKVGEFRTQNQYSISDIIGEYSESR